VTGPLGPRTPPYALRDTFSGTGEATLTACGLSWCDADIARFLQKVRYDPETGCWLWTGARSRGRGNTAWYGSFWAKGKTVRAHKFSTVALMGFRPRPGIDHLDHYCPNSLCVSCLQVVPEWVNLALRWIRVQVGLDPDRERSLLVDYTERRGHDLDELQDTIYCIDPDDTSDIDYWRSGYIGRRFSAIP